MKYLAAAAQQAQAMAGFPGLAYHLDRILAANGDAELLFRASEALRAAFEAGKAVKRSKRGP